MKRTFRRHLFVCWTFLAQVQLISSGDASFYVCTFQLPKTVWPMKVNRAWTWPRNGTSMLSSPAPALICTPHRLHTCCSLAHDRSISILITHTSALLDCSRWCAYSIRTQCMEGKPINDVTRFQLFRPIGHRFLASSLLRLPRYSLVACSLLISRSKSRLRPNAHTLECSRKRVYAHIEELHIVSSFPFFFRLLITRVISPPEYHFASHGNSPNALANMLSSWWNFLEKWTVDTKIRHVVFLMSLSFSISSRFEMHISELHTNALRTVDVMLLDTIEMIPSIISQISSISPNLVLTIIKNWTCAHLFTVAQSSHTIANFLALSHCRTHMNVTWHLSFMLNVISS